MSNAEEIYNQINNHADITALIGRPETLFLDFKTSSTTDGRLTNDDKNNFKEALSGFSHQEGGVIVWGMDCRPHPETGIDQAITEAPISHIGNFLTTIQDYFPYTTEPLVDGVQHRLISTNDDPATNTGFVVTYIPKSYKVHRILAHRGTQFYKRYGSSFRPVDTTEEIRSLFSRQTAPVLEVTVNHQGTLQSRNLNVQFSIKNIGAISAKNLSIRVLFIPLGGMSYYDEGGNNRWDTWTMAVTGDGGRGFYLSNGLVLHPEQDMRVFTASGFFGEQNQRPIRLDYVIYAENMEPIKGSAELPPT